MPDIAVILAILAHTVVVSALTFFLSMRFIMRAAERKIRADIQSKPLVALALAIEPTFSQLGGYHYAERLRSHLRNSIHSLCHRRRHQALKKRRERETEEARTYVGPIYPASPYGPDHFQTAFDPAGLALRDRQEPREGALGEGTQESGSGGPGEPGDGDA